MRGAALAVAVLLGGCTADDPAGTEPTGFDAIDSSGSESPETDGPRLQGSYLVTKTIVEVDPPTVLSGRVGDTDTRIWEFRPSCESGACGGSLTSTNPATGQLSTARFEWGGDTYTFRARSTAPCGKGPEAGTATLVVSYTLEPGRTDEQGRARAFTGEEQLTYSAEEGSDCPSGTNTSRVEARSV